MIYVLSLNPCVDKTVSLARFELDSANRVTPIREDAGGKGMNVSRMLANLGSPVHLVGFTFTGTKNVLEDALETGRVPYTLIPCQGKLRVNLKIQDQSRHATIEINEESAPVTDADLRALTDTLSNALKENDILILTGSLPKGAPCDLYRTLCDLGHEKGCFVAADCDGAALTEVLKGAPDLIKPNRQELRKHLGTDPETPEEAKRMLQQLIRDTGVRYVCHSRGKDGAMMVTEDDCIFLDTLDVPALGVYGAGDAMLAGVCHALMQGKTPAEALCFGVSASCATIQLPGTQMGTKESVLSLLPLCRPQML